MGSISRFGLHVGATRIAGGLQLVHGHVDRIVMKQAFNTTEQMSLLDGTFLVALAQGCQDRVRLEQDQLIGEKGGINLSIMYVSRDDGSAAQGVPNTFNILRREQKGFSAQQCNLTLYSINPQS